MTLARSSYLLDCSPGEAESGGSEARKMLSDSAWAKRTKFRSTIKSATYIRPIENPGTTAGGVAAGPMLQVLAYETRCAWLQHRRAP
jgi:hypothetical protein